jgi:hyperosmotically inducible protein
MRAMKAVKIMSGALLVATCLLAHAQGGAASAASPAAGSGAVAGVPTDTVSNRQLAAAVRAALRKLRRNGLKSDYIRVRAREGVVTLSGVVANVNQISLANNVAQGVSGVKSVNNKLQVRSPAGLKGNQ